MCTLYLLTPRTKAKKQAERIVVEQQEKKVKSLPIAKVTHVVAGENTELTTALLRELLHQGVPVSFVDFSGRLLG